MHWIDGGKLGRCFLFVKKQDLVLEWTEANEYCKERGGFLTDVLNQDTFDFISIHMLDVHVVDAEGLGELDNAGEECWWECNKQQGKCDWCGTEGWCCRMNWKGNGCDGSIGGANNHQCTLNPKAP